MGVVNPSGLFVNLYGGRPDTTDGVYDVIKTYSLVDGDSINSVATQFYNEFAAYSNNTLNSNPNTEIYSLVLGVNVRNSADTGTLAQTLATLYLDFETCHYRASSRLKIQNRTNSVTGGTTIEANDANPLEGYIYDFNGAPRLKQVGTGDFKTMPSEWCTKTFGASILPADFVEPPPASIFSNCKGRFRVHLDPGQVKEYTVYISGKMNVKKLLKRMASDVSGGLTIDSMWKSKMIALEELINSNDVNAVKLGFENRNSVEVCMKTSRRSTVTAPVYRAFNIIETV